MRRRRRRRAELFKRLFRLRWREGINGVRSWLHVLTAAVALAGLGSFRLDITDPGLVHLFDWERLLGNAVVVALLVMLWAAYLHLRQPRLVASVRMWSFLILLVVGVAVLGRAADLLAPYLVPAAMGAYVVPVALGAGLATLFAGAEAGFAMTVLLAFWVGVGGQLSAAAMLAALGSGTVAVIRCSHLRRLSELPLAGLEVGLVGVLLHGGAVLLAQGVDGINGIALLWSGLNGLVSALLIFGGMPLAEVVTQKTSPLGLVELLNPSHPLLGLLRERAPGTYHHSFNVADLAESAAQAVGADPLLAKVGGYYHDIGKIKRPEFFVENQPNGQNPHDEISPSMSKMILTSHVKEGIELAQEYGLRSDIVQFIRQHHGTSVIRYFYHKALREGKASADSMDDYRYATEHPQTKETAIVMLADGVEAASRSAADPSQLEEVIDEAIRIPFEDEQLKDSPLTLRDLERIKKSFFQTLRAMRHERTGASSRAGDGSRERAR